MFYTWVSNVVCMLVVNKLIYAFIYALSLWPSSSVVCREKKTL